MNDRQMRTTIGLGLIGAGIVVAVLGYLGVSRETEVAFQLPYFASAAVGALMLLGGGAALLLAGQLERDSDRLGDLEDAVRQLAVETQRLVDELAPPRRRRVSGG
jgi:hypothetical protein